MCDKQPCDILNCVLRHQKTCKFYKEYKRCKFNPCSFKHIENGDDLENIVKENKALLEKLSEIERDLEILTAKEKETEDIIKDLESKHEVDNISKAAKIEKLEDVVKEMNLKVFDQDKKIDMLHKKIGVLKENNKEKEKKLKDFEEKYENLSKKVDGMSTKMDYLI